MMTSKLEYVGKNITKYANISFNGQKSTGNMFLDHIGIKKEINKRKIF